MKTVKQISTGKYLHVPNELATALVTGDGKYRYSTRGALKSVRNKAKKIQNTNMFFKRRGVDIAKAIDNEEIKVYRLGKNAIVQCEKPKHHRVVQFG